MLVACRADHHDELVNIMRLYWWAVLSMVPGAWSASCAATVVWVDCGCSLCTAPCAYSCFAHVRPCARAWPQWPMPAWVWCDVQFFVFFFVVFLLCFLAAGPGRCGFLCVTRRKQHRPGTAPNANTTHVPTAGSSAAPTKPNHTPTRHPRAKGKYSHKWAHPTPHEADAHTATGV